jgi:hypothetical protein
MAKIVFWNIQRGGGNSTSPTTADLADDLQALAFLQPDIIILCEGVGDLLLNSQNYLPNGYAMANIDVQFGGYKALTTLQYVAMYRNGVQCSFHLIDTTTSSGTNFGRPALLICYKKRNLIALHAQSVTSTTRVQSEQMVKTYDKVMKLIDDQFFMNLSAPCMIFGDLNIDGGNTHKVGNMRGRLMGTSLNGFSVCAPDNCTHRNAKTGLYDKTLDWGLTEVGFAPHVETVGKTTYKRSKQHGKSKRNVKKKKTMDYSGYGKEDWVEPESNDDSDESSNDEWQMKYENVKSSDHKPIMFTW